MTLNSPRPRTLRYSTRALAAALALVIVLTTSIVEAGPQWRLRRWSSRPPIDPTIRSTVAFGQPQATSRHYRTRSIGVSGYHRMGR